MTRGAYAHVFDSRVVIIMSRFFLQQQKNSGPMFTYLAFQNGHNPYQVPDGYSNKYSHIESADRRAMLGKIIYYLSRH